MDVECSLCHALHWIDEKVADSPVRNPTFSKCCHGGKVALPPFSPPLPLSMAFSMGPTPERESSSAASAATTATFNSLRKASSSAHQPSPAPGLAPCGCKAGHTICLDPCALCQASPPVLHSCTSMTLTRLVLGLCVFTYSFHTRCLYPSYLTHGIRRRPGSKLPLQLERHWTLLSCRTCGGCCMTATLLLPLSRLWHPPPPPIW